jgi:hypothetical protein
LLVPRGVDQSLVQKDSFNKNISVARARDSKDRW